MPETPDQSSDQTAELEAETIDAAEALPQGPGALFTFVYYFSGASLITVLFTVKTLGVGFNAGITGPLALVLGALGGVAGVFFNQTKTLEMTVAKPKAFDRQLAETLTDMGYSLTETMDGVARYRRSPFSRLFSGDIYVQKQDSTVWVVSRAANIRTLSKRLE